MGVFFLESASLSAHLVVFAFAKFICARFVNSLNPMSLISVLINHWTCLFGMPESIVCDRGTHFLGLGWNTICDTHSVKMVMAPTWARYQVGTAERQVELVKRSYRKITASVPGSYSRRDKLALLCAAKNITPSSTSSWPPLFLVSGRSGHVAGLLNSRPPSSTLPKDSDAYPIWERMLLINELRGSLLKMGAEIAADMAQRKRLRNTHNEMSRHNGPVAVWSQGDKRWHSGFRFLFDSGANMVLERGSRLVKSPIQWVKPHIQENHEPLCNADEGNHTPRPKLSDISRPPKLPGNETNDNTSGSSKSRHEPGRSNSPTGAERAGSPTRPLQRRRYHLRSPDPDL